MRHQYAKLFREESNKPSKSEETLEAEAFAALEREDSEKAQELFKKMAALGSSVACYCLGNMYLLGEGGTITDAREAKKWYERAIGSSVTRLTQYAAIRLGFIYEVGYDESGRCPSAIDNEKAFYYYKMAEDSDIAIGLLRLGIMYAMGKGTPKNLDRAEALYRRAASRHVVALKNLGILKLDRGNVTIGLSLWISAIVQGVFLSIFKPNSPRIWVI